MDKMLKFYVKVFLCDGQGTVRRAILYVDRSCSACMYKNAGRAIVVTPTLASVA